MRIRILCVSKRPGDWVARASQEYLKRFTGQLDVQIIDIAPATHRTRAITLDKEAEKLRRALPRQAHVVALDERGNAWSTKQLAQQLQHWRETHNDVVCIIGSAAGLAASVLDDAHTNWSLSPLTLPHQLARVIVVEQLYRAWSLLHGHPYHRE